MTRVIIIGNSGAARECYWLYQDMRDGGMAPDSVFGGFLSWQGYKGELKDLGHFFLGSAEEYSINEENCFVIGIGDPALRKKIYEDFKAKNARFFTLQHPLAQINPTAQIGEANIFQRGSVVLCNAKLGNANYLNGSVTVSHDVQIGDYNFFGPFSIILGKVTIQSENSFATLCTVLPKGKIGNCNKFAPGSVVYKGCKDGWYMAGNPALNMESAKIH